MVQFNPRLNFEHFDHGKSIFIGNKEEKSLKNIKFTMKKEIMMHNDYYCSNVKIRFLFLLPK